MAKISLRKILNTVNTSYNGGEGRINESLPPGARGDTLADFLAFEIRDVCQGEINPQDMLMAARQAVLKAKEELDDVYLALEKL